MFLDMQIYLNHLFDTARYSRDIRSTCTGKHGLVFEGLADGVCVSFSAV